MSTQHLTRRAALAALGAAPVLLRGTARAQAPMLTLGVLSDFSGAYSSWGGKGSVVATEMAIQEFKAAQPGFPYKVDVISADFVLKPDNAVTIGREWISRGVNAILDIPHTASALAVNGLVRGTDTAALITGSAGDDLVTRDCSPNMVQWTYDQHSVATPTFATVAKGGKWFFIMQDSLPGQAFEAIARRAIDATGGKVLGLVRTPSGTPDFAGPIVQAQASGADAIVLVEGGVDFVNAIKQASEFGVREQGQKIAVPFAVLPDIQALGLSAAQGLIFTEAFYWDLDDGTRRFSARFAQRFGRPPTSLQAGAYSATLHYLKAVAAGSSAKGPEVVARMKAIPVSDDAFGQATLREDGRMVHDMVLVQVKKPGEAKGEWDLYDVLRRIPGAEAFRPPSSACALVSGAAKPAMTSTAPGAPVR